MSRERGWLTAWRRRVTSLKRDILALYLAVRDPRVPWLVKVLAGLVLAYALSPFDLIPDIIPVLGYLDDLLIVPIGLLFVSRLIPAPILEEHRERAAGTGARAPFSRLGAVITLLLWLLSLMAVAWLLRGQLPGL